MDSFLLEQHLRGPALRLFPDPLMPQMIPQDPEAQAAFIEKARQHLQMWGRSPYSELLLPQIYQRPHNLGALNLGLAWQAGQWPPQLSAGFLNAAVAASAPRTPPPVSTTPASSSGSPSPDMRSKHFQPRFSPYQIPQPDHRNSSASSRSSPPSTNNNNNNNSNN